MGISGWRAGPRPTWRPNFDGLAGDAAEQRYRARCHRRSERPGRTGETSAPTGSPRSAARSAAPGFRRHRRTVPAEALREFPGSVTVDGRSGALVAVARAAAGKSSASGRFRTAAARTSCARHSSTCDVVEARDWGKPSLLAASWLAGEPTGLSFQGRLGNAHSPTWIQPEPLGKRPIVLDEGIPAQDGVLTPSPARRHRATLDPDGGPRTPAPQGRDRPRKRRVRLSLAYLHSAVRPLPSSLARARIPVRDALRTPWQRFAEGPMAAGPWRRAGTAPSTVQPSRS